ncbi:MAG: tol-pal system-associated acyl-CoA thioesterase [Pseudomonadota bacterium]
MTHEFRLRVYYEDTDAGGVVYHANYLCFVERARTEAFIELNLSQTGMRETRGLLFMVRAATLDFRAPAFLEDELLVLTTVSEMGGARIEMHHELYRQGRLIVTSDVTLVCVNAEGRATRIPADIRETLSSLSAEEVSTQT